MKKPFKDTVFIEDARLLAGQLPFSLMLKPVGPACNLKCTYCYYLGNSLLWGGKTPVMTEGLLETAIRNYFESLPPGADAAFDWHGGEPLLAGLPFYRKAVQMQKEYSGGRPIHNTLQTNGTLVNGQWAEFFAQEGFLIGLSLDGPQAVHDSMRRSAGGSPTFDKALRGFQTLLRHGVQVNTMTAVNKSSEGRGPEVYSFLKSIGSNYIQFLPVVEFADGAPTDWSLTAKGWGDFLCSIFDIWVKKDVGRVFVNHFDAALCSWCGENRGTCIFDRTCRPNAVVEHNGDVFPCDHFVSREHLAGNIKKDSLRQISQAMVRFCLEKRNSLPAKCLRCEYLFACNGECPQHRYSGTNTGKDGVNALCEGYFRFFRHAAPQLDTMRALLVQGRAPADILLQFKP